MSARKTAKPRKARKPKFIEVEGHQLTPELYRAYELAIESRQRINRGDPQSRIEKTALADVLARFRFSSRTREILPELYQELSSVALAVAALDRYPFFASCSRHVRLAGCDALNRLATEAQFLGAKIHAIGEAIRYEDGGHLQDWLKRQAAFDAASPYGLAPTVQP